MRGLLGRHLVMPEGIAGTDEIASFLSREISSGTYLNIMAQYYPCGTATDDPVIGRPLRSVEFRAALATARRAGLRRGIE